MGYVSAKAESLVKTFKRDHVDANPYYAKSEVLSRNSRTGFVIT